MASECVIVDAVSFHSLAVLDNAILRRMEGMLLFHLGGNLVASPVVWEDGNTVYKLDSSRLGVNRLAPRTLLNIVEDGLLLHLLRVQKRVVGVLMAGVAPGLRDAETRHSAP